jgi:hypothetical protein
MNAFTILARMAPSDGAYPSGSHWLIWRCHCGGHNPSRTSDAADESARAATRPAPRPIQAVSGRTSAHRATAPRAFRPRRLLRRIAPAMNPQEKPRPKNPRARRLFLRATADAVNPHVAAMMATASSREIRCVGPSEPISPPPGRRLRGRWPDPTTVFAGPALLATVRDQSEREVLAVRCNTTSGMPPSSSSTAYEVPADGPLHGVRFPAASLRTTRRIAGPI